MAEGAAQSVKAMGYFWPKLNLQDIYHRSFCRAEGGSRMHVPNQCITCGAEIGHVAASFRIALSKRLQKEAHGKNTVPSLVTTNYQMDMDVSDLYEKFGIRHDCCRTCLSTSMIFKEQY